MLESSILFHTEDISFSLDDEEKTSHWIKEVISLSGSSLGVLNYVFCSDNYLLEINKNHLQHDYYTDIITFPLSENPLEADLFISVDRVKENALTLGISFTEELHRVIIHGVLHLIGYGDKTEEEQLKMRAKENECLMLLI